MQPLATRFLSVGLVMELLFLSSPAFSADPGLVDHEARRIALIQGYAQDPKALAISTTRAVAARRGLSGVRLDAFVNDYKRSYEALETLYRTGKYPYERLDQLQIDLAKTAFQTTINDYAKNRGPLAGKLLDAGLELFEGYVASEDIDRAGKFLADRNYQAIVNVERSVSLILDTPGLRDGIISDIGVDISQSAQQLRDRFPGVEVALARSELITGIRSTHRSLAEIAEEIARLDENDQARKDQLVSELSGILKEYFTSFNGEITDELASLAEQQETYQQELLGDVGKNRALLGAFIADQNERDAKREEAEAKRRLREEEAAHERGYIQGVAFLLDRVHPGAGQKVSAMVNGGMQIRAAIQTFQDLETVEFGNLVQLAAGIGNPAMGIFSALSAVQGPSTDEVILEELAGIAEQIRQLREHLDARFDAVDARLDRIQGILAGVQISMTQVSRKVAINLEATSRNLRVGLDTQSLLLSVSQSLSDTIKDTWLVPCIQRASTLPLTDEAFINCVSFLYNYANTQLAREQIPWDSARDDATLANLLARSDGATLDLMKHEFEVRSGIRAPANTLVPPDAWRTVAGWYRDFLVRDVAQTRRAAIISRAEFLAARGREIEEFREMVLNAFDLSAWRRGESGFFAPVAFFESGEQLVREIRSVIEGAVDSYLSDTGLPLTSFNLEYPWYHVSCAGLGCPFDWGYAVPTTNKKINEAAFDQVSTLIPLTVLKALGGGMGRLLIDIRLEGYSFYPDNRPVESHFDPPISGPVPAPGFWTCRGGPRFGKPLDCAVAFERFRATVSFSAFDGVGVASQDVGHFLVYCAPFVEFAPVGTTYYYTVGAPPNPTSFRCPDLSEAVREWAAKRAPGTGASFFNESLSLNEEAFAFAWEHHRNEIADIILTELESPALNDRFALENAFFGSLVRFAFSNNLDFSDALLGFATGSVGLPLPSSFAAYARELRRTNGDEIGLPAVWDVRDFVTTDVRALGDYVFAGDLDLHLEVARADLGLPYSSLQLANADLLLQAVCGDGLAVPGEECDDGNVVPGDGCSPTCQLELCGNGVDDPGELCDDGNVVSGDECDANCTLTACGNGIVTLGEQCDDGNDAAEDGCEPDCTSPTSCGNHIITPPEECDDGNKLSGDGCDSNCTPTACGNGVATMSEQCDDGNTESGDGCDENCMPTACGNGIATHAEGCDDGNLASGDGCDANCTDTGCGNSVVTPPEECDDGNPIDHDRCTNECLVPEPAAPLMLATGAFLLHLLGSRTRSRRG